MAEAHSRPGPNVSRRDFVKTAALAATSPLILPTWARADGPTVAGPTPKAPAETAVARFYATLKDEQRKLICFPFDDPKRSQVQNNWHIVKPTIKDLSKEQQALCDEVFKGLCSEEGYERFRKQMDHDYGGIENYSVAVFGEPGTDKPFEWVLTGRHDTLRADGNSVEGAAFGGPIFYGHDATRDQQRRVGQAYRQRLVVSGPSRRTKFSSTLDDKQKAQGPRPPRPRRTTHASRSNSRGISSPTTPASPSSELDGDQKKMVQKLLTDMLPARSAPLDAEEVHECLKDAGGASTNCISPSSRKATPATTSVWDIWKLEGPAFSWYFHGSPHVHTWLNVARKALKVSERISHFRPAESKATVGRDVTFDSEPHRKA